MHLIKSVVSLVAVVAVTACGGVEQQGGLGTQEAALVSGTSQGCLFKVSSAARPGPVPPIFDVTVTRYASSTCAWGAGSVLVGNSSAREPTVSLAANELGVAVAYTYGKYAGSVSLKHLSPDTLAVVRTEGLAPTSPQGYILSGNLAIASDGTTLTVSGTKNWPIIGETGSGDNYVATYPDFFTSTTAPSIVAF
ncbi:hypothetical protein [Corallococcus sp. Z5C101001]|uniref:hypothetical protein n=1 Tax=Corallococcus sp. Z5C101001 TaxID=2596829 RepID=UPI00117D18A9|nr:hypothetical protein [Corallococcus sp. Z5C101001]TSC31171.1 hypothetical protein FOF48_10735 [Corallococcus sp. Z5C101001]